MLVGKRKEKNKTSMSAAFTVEFIPGRLFELSPPSLETQPLGPLRELFLDVHKVLLFHHHHHTGRYWEPQVVFF